MIACIKFITKNQVVRVKTDSDVDKKYVVSEVEVSTKAAKSVAGLADGLASLAIGQNDFEIYEMDWRTKIHLQEGGEELRSGAGQTLKKTVRLLLYYS
jgi:hypothetical protein